MSNITTVTVSKETRGRLEQLRAKNEKVEDVIVRLLDAYSPPAVVHGIGAGSPGKEEGAVSSHPISEAPSSKPKEPEDASFLVE